MEIYSHKCVKCKIEYQDTEPEPYYCENCNKERLALAKEVDSKLGSTVGQQPGGELVSFEMEARRTGIYAENGKGNSRVFLRSKL